MQRSTIILRDVKKIRTRGYPRIKPAMGRKWILKMNIHGYGYIFYISILTGRVRVS